MIKFSSVKVWWFALAIVLFAACEDVGLRDYVNDHVVGARFSTVRNADGSPVDRLPSGEMVVNWGDAAPVVLQVVLDNPRRTLYGVS
jgi:hypothetical protein